MSDNDNTVKVDPDIETICCDGGQDELGHPAVYYTFDQSNKIICSYCSKTYIRNKNKHTESTKKIFAKHFLGGCHIRKYR